MDQVDQLPLDRLKVFSAWQIVRLWDSDNKLDLETCRNHPIPRPTSWPDSEWLQVNISSLSEAAGLEAGDLLLAVNGEDVESCRHKEAQDTIVRSGNNLTLTVRRWDLWLVRAPTWSISPQRQRSQPGSEASRWWPDPSGGRDSAEAGQHWACWSLG